VAPRIATPSPNATQDRPTYPPRVQRTEILFDPFDDIVPREKVARARGRARDRARVRVRWSRRDLGSKILPNPKPHREKVVAEEVVAKRPKRKEKKNLALLSFGEEAAEEERDLSKVGSPSPEP